MKRKQKLVEIVKQKSQNLKEAAVIKIPRCSTCQAKMKFTKIQDQAFMSCQKIKIMTNMKTGHLKS